MGKAQSSSPSLAWKSLQQPPHCRQGGGGVGVCILEREKHGTWGPAEHAQGTGTLLLHEQHQGRARCARNHRSCRWARGGITPKPLCFCNTKVETESQRRGRPASPFLLARRPAAAPLCGWAAGSTGRQALQHFCRCSSGDRVCYCPRWELGTTKNPSISG